MSVAPGYPSMGMVKGPKSGLMKYYTDEWFVENGRFCSVLNNKLCERDEIEEMEIMLYIESLID